MKRARETSSGPVAVGTVGVGAESTKPNSPMKHPSGVISSSSLSSVGSNTTKGSVVSRSAAQNSRTDITRDSMVMKIRNQHQQFQPKFQPKDSGAPAPVAAVVRTLPPPPPIMTFSDDTSEEDSSSREEVTPPDVREPKKVRTTTSSSSPPRPAHLQSEPHGWRAAAIAILEGGPITVGKGLSKRSFAVVCSSNVNRSIMAQKLLEENDMRAKSYGTGREVKLPGKDSKSPQSFPFGTPYIEIHDKLASQDEELFRRNSVLGLLARDAATKRAPERWQALRGDEVASFDVVVCFESRVFDLVVEDLHSRDPDMFKPLHIVSMTIRDSAQDSAAAAGDVLELCKMLDECEDLDQDAPKMLSEFRNKSKRTVLHQVCHI